MIIKKHFGRRPHRLAGMTLAEVVVALAIVGITMAGTVMGYTNCAKASVKAELQQAANAKAMERLEATRSAIWAPSRSMPVDQLITNNFPDLVVSLDQSGTNLNGTLATIRTTIAAISTSPPLRSVHVECVWQFQTGEWITNSIETIRSFDQ